MKGYKMKEYKVVKENFFILEDKLNAYAKDGWELVGYSSGKSIYGIYWVYTFSREKDSEWNTFCSQLNEQEER